MMGGGWHRSPLRENFDFPRRFRLIRRRGAAILSSKTFSLEFKYVREGVLRIIPDFGRNFSLLKIRTRNILLRVTRKQKILCFSDETKYGLTLQVNPGNANIEFKLGNVGVEAIPGFLGKNGMRTMFAFRGEQNDGFYGFGEKTGRLNKRNSKLHMWNVDVIGDHPHSYKRDDYDPTYASIPFFILKRRGVYFGFFLDNAEHTYFDLMKNRNEIQFGGYSGRSSLYVFAARKIDDVVRTFYSLTGPALMPPLWALGHHQCRYSYFSEREIRKVVSSYRKHRIPLNAVWLDIDYMDGYRVFSWNRNKFPRISRMTRELRSLGIHTVAILDPGIKVDPGWGPYSDGIRKKMFTKTVSGGNYVGIVWPGHSVFPDFSEPRVRSWWADLVKRFIQSTGISGLWNDMNDPATFDSDISDMRFKDGRLPHESFHNQYGTLMARSSMEGLLKNNPRARPFVLSRSGSAGIQRYAAVWTGDNVSSFEHLRMSIAQSLNLSLSGVSFNGPDIGGFDGNTTESLITRWYQAGFLFPFFRNHTNLKTRHQEPYRFSKRALIIIRKFINLRYKFLPHLYTLFHDYVRTGCPVLRPLMYHYSGFDDVDDQFLVGDAILQAPILSENSSRTIRLPRGWWYDYFIKHWFRGPTSLQRKFAPRDTGMFIKDGSIIPVYAGKEFHDPGSRSRETIQFMIFARSGTASGSLYEDDGETMDYRKGSYNRYEAELKHGKLRVHMAHEGYKTALRLRAVHV